MPVAGLFMVGAATWPGAGNNAMSGYLAAREILRARRARLWAIGGGAGAAIAAATATMAAAMGAIDGGR